MSRGGRSGREGSAGFEDGLCDEQEFSGDGDEGGFAVFAIGAQFRFMVAGGECGEVEQRAQPGIPAAAHRAANALLLRLIGLTSLLYAPLDIISDTLLRPNLHSDARALAELTFIPGVVWGALWCAASLVLAWWFLRQAARTG